MSVGPAEETRLGYLQSILESCDDAVYSQDSDGLITGWSRGAARVLWYPADQVIGWRSTRLYAEDRWVEHEVVLRRVLGGEAQTQVETDLRRSDGQIVPAVLSAAPIRDSLRRVIGASVIAHDVTDQRLALGALAESEARRREVESLAQVGGWVLDVATGAVQWSEELHRLHGLNPPAFDGTLAGHLALVQHDDRRQVEADLARAVTEAEPFIAEYRVVRPDHQVRWLCSRAVPVVDAKGVVIGLRGVCQDVTDRRPGPVATPVVQG